MYRYRKLLIMRIPVEIMVTNKRLDYREMHALSDAVDPKETIDSFSGFMETNGKGFVIEYTEDYDGFNELDTSVIYENGMALISRRGEINTNLVFVPKSSCDCVYYSGYRQLSLRVTTKELVTDISALGGKLKIDYTVDVMGNMAEQNTICLSVCPIESVS